MAIQEKDATSSVGQSSETTSTSSSPSAKGSDVTTYPYRSTSARHVVWRSVTTPIGAIFISVVVMVALLSFGMGASLTSNGNTSASSASTSTSSSSTNMGDTQTTPATTNVPNATQQYGNQLAKYIIDRDGAKHFTFTAQQVMWEVVKGHRVLAWTINGTVPGPMIRVTSGDHVRVTFINHFPTATAVHWHGLEVATGQDGVPGVGMKPIQPGQTYVYDFTVHDQDVGSHWYHTHYDDMTQMTGGLYGAFIVDPRPGTIQAQQAIHADVEYTAFISTMPGGYYVINGKSFPDTQPILVKHGQTVHIRMIGADTMMMHPMHIHGHTFSVVAEDGHALTQPYQKDTVQVAPGESYDLTFNAWAPPGSIYPIHCHILSHLMNPGQSGEEMGGLIILIEYAK
ncbi:MAG: multicopper oxidase family protein [Ktedonobacteraceae bacterium]